MTFDTVDDLLKALRSDAPIDQDLVDATADLFDRTPAEGVAPLCTALLDGKPSSPRVWRLNDELVKDPRFHAAMGRAYKARGPRPTPAVPGEEPHKESPEERLARERRNVVVRINEIQGCLEAPVTEETLALARKRLSYLRDDTQARMDALDKEEP